MPVSAGHVPIRHHDVALVGSSDRVDWRIELDERSKRHIALLCLPVLRVRVTVKSETQRAIDAFIADFLLAYQRAGG